MAPPKRLARAGFLPIVTNMGSLSVVLLCSVKPVWVGSDAEGLRFKAGITAAAA